MDTRNFVRLVGNLGTDPKVTETKNGKVARFS
jgi:single-stranded DNA-binding protein